MSEREAHYQRHRRRLLLGRVRVGAWLAVVLVPTGAILELLAFPAYVGSMLVLRLIFAVLAGVFIVLARQATMERFASGFSLAVTIAFAALVELMVELGPGPDSAYYAGHLMVMISVGMLFPWSPWEMAAAALSILAVHLLGASLAHQPIPWYAVNTNAYLMGVAGLILVVASVAAERLRRREFFGRMELEEQSAALYEARTRLEGSLVQLRALDESKSRFFAHVSHELRTPLTLILVPLDELRREWVAGLPPVVGRRLDLVHRSTLRLVDLVDRLLELSRAQSGRLALRWAAIDAAAFTEAVLEPFRPVARSRRQSLRLEVEPGTVLEADPEKLETILRNLLTNALKFTPEGGEVRVQVSADAQRARIVVRDTGIGVAPEDQERIFEPFRRVEGAGGARVGGTGIGLSLVRELAAAHGGTVRLESAVGAGCAFRVELPRRPEVAGAAPLRQPEQGGAPLLEPAVAEPEESGTAGPGARRILVVEDEPSIRAELTRILGRHWQVEAVADAESALARLNGDLPDLVLCDVMLPGMSGMELTEQLRSRPATAHLPIILLTARGGIDALVEGLERGADDFLEKPFAPPALVARVRARLRARA